MRKKATYGKSMKKAKSGSKMKKAKSGMKMAKSGLKKPKASQKGLKKLPKTVRNKMGYAKKGKTVKKAGYGKKTMKAKSGCSTGRKRK